MWNIYGLPTDLLSPAFALRVSPQKSQRVKTTLKICQRSFLSDCKLLWQEKALITWHYQQNWFSQELLCSPAIHMYHGSKIPNMLPVKLLSDLSYCTCAIMHSESLNLWQHNKEQQPVALQTHLFPQHSEEKVHEDSVFARVLLTQCIDGLHHYNLEEKGASQKEDSLIGQEYK